jgi:hypothetical protein
MTTINDVLDDLKQDIANVESTEINPSAYVVIWKSNHLPDNDPLNTTYALCNRVCNKIGEAQDVSIFPSLELVKMMKYDEATDVAFERSYLYNGRDDVFRSCVLKATSYKDMLLAEYKRQLASLESFILRHK